MENYQKYKNAYPNKTDAEIIESLAWELSDKVETIHKLLEVSATTEKVVEKLKKQKDVMGSMKMGFTSDEQIGYYNGQEAMLDSVIEDFEGVRSIYIGECNGVDMFASKERLNKIVHDCLCDGLHYFGGYGIDIGYDKEEYKKAKEQLVSEEKKEICFEDVIMQILIGGGELKFTDVEGEGCNDSSLKLTEKIYNRFRKIPNERLLNLIKEEYDADDADVVIQTLVYGEILFG